MLKNIYKKQKQKMSWAALVMRPKTRSFVLSRKELTFLNSNIRVLSPYFIYDIGFFPLKAGQQAFSFAVKVGKLFPCKPLIFLFLSQYYYGAITLALSA